MRTVFTAFILMPRYALVTEAVLLQTFATFSYLYKKKKELL